MILAGCQINPIDVNFHLQNFFKFLIKIQLPKIWSKKDKGWKVPCLMPIKVKVIQPNEPNFYLKKSLEIFDKNLADKSWSKKDKGWKVPSIMPIRGAKLKKLWIFLFLFTSNDKILEVWLVSLCVLNKITLK